MKRFFASTLMMFMLNSPCNVAITWSASLCEEVRGQRKYMLIGRQLLYELTHQQQRNLRRQKVQARLFVAYDFLDFSDFNFTKVFHCPVAFTATNV